MSGRRAEWRTPAREAILRRDWPEGIRRDLVHARMLEAEGPDFPAHYIGLWATHLRLRRPGSYRRAVARAAAEAASRARQLRAVPQPVARAGAPAPPADEAGPVPLLPAGVMRETPALRAAFELLELGLVPSTIRDRVKLTATEFAKIRGVHAEGAQ